MPVNTDASKHPAYHSKHIQPQDLEGKQHSAQVIDVIEVDAWNPNARQLEKKLALRLKGWAWYLLLNKTNNAFMCATYGKMSGAWVGKVISMIAGRHISGKPTIIISASTEKLSPPASSTKPPVAKGTQPPAQPIKSAPPSRQVNEETGEISGAQTEI